MDNAFDVTDDLFRNFFKHDGIFEDIVSDRDPKFTSKILGFSDGTLWSQVGDVKHPKYSDG